VGLCYRWGRTDAMLAAMEVGHLVRHGYADLEFPMSGEAYIIMSSSEEEGRYWYIDLTLILVAW